MVVGMASFAKVENSPKVRERLKSIPKTDQHMSIL